MHRQRAVPGSITVSHAGQVSTGVGKMWGRGRRVTGRSGGAGGAGGTLHPGPRFTGTPRRIAADAAVHNRSACSFIGSPQCPRTQVNRTDRPVSATSSSRRSARFAGGWPSRFRQPLRFQSGSQRLRLFTTNWLSVRMSSGWGWGTARSSARTANISATWLDARGNPPAAQHCPETYHAQPAGPRGLSIADPSVAATTARTTTVIGGTRRLFTYRMFTRPWSERRMRCRDQH